MKLLERLIVGLGKIVTTLMIISGSLIFFLIIGLTIYELSGRSTIGMATVLLLLIIGFFLGIKIATLSNQIGYVTFISKVSATNEMDDSEKGKEWISSRE